MLWCQFLPFAALWGCPQAPKVPPGSIDKVVITTFVAELLPPPPPVTVTVTVGIVATPVVPATPVPDFYPSATPGAHPTALKYADTPDWSILHTPLSYHNEIIAFGHWFEEASFTVRFEVTLLRLIMAAFMLSFVQMLFLLYNGELLILRDALKSLFKSLRIGSKVLWTLMSGVILCLTYDQLTESPATTIFYQLLFLTQVHQDFVSRFVHRILFVRQTDWQSLVPHCPLGRAIFDICRRKFAVVWTRSIHFLASAMVKLVSLLWNLSSTCFRHVVTVLTEQGYTWKSPFRLLRTLTCGLWRFSFGLLLYARLLIWVYVQRPCPCNGKTPWEVSPDLATSWLQQQALIDLARMSLWDMAATLIERDDLKQQLRDLEPAIRASIERDIQGTTVELGKRAISWRDSHREMGMDYNHCRQILDNAMNLVVYLIMNIDPNGPYAVQFFKTSKIVVLDEPEASGLHYKPDTTYGKHEVGPDYKMRLGADMKAILARMRVGIKAQRYTFIGRMDMYNEKTWTFDLRQMGFQMPGFLAKHNPFDLSKPRPKNPHREREFEDYAAEGRITEWYPDLPARRERLAQRAHAFFRT